MSTTTQTEKIDLREVAWGLFCSWREQAAMLAERAQLQAEAAKRCRTSPEWNGLVRAWVESLAQANVYRDRARRLADRWGFPW